jgi:hypothetical protein
MVPVNHFEPSTSAMPSCLRVSSLLKFVIPNWSANPKVWSSGALGGIFPCRHPWLETVTHDIIVPTAPLGNDREAPSDQIQPLAIWILDWYLCGACSEGSQSNRCLASLNRKLHSSKKTTKLLGFPLEGAVAASDEIRALYLREESFY